MSGRFGFCLALVCCALLFALPAAAAPAAESGDTISVRGSAAREVAPDVAYITLGVSARDEKTEKAGAETAARVDGIVKSLAALGIGKKEIKTENFSVRPVYQPEENRRERAAAYEVENILTIHIRNLDAIGAVIDAALAAGANKFSGVRFAASGAAALQKELLSEAVRDGREKADIVAQSAGRRVGALLRAEVDGAGAQARALKSLDAAEFAGNQIFAGAITLTASVNLTFALEQTGGRQ
ncbi:MAG: SIMPL domain-containing protein [Acidaminococcales bacterium]|jgi:uncharacterized protein YggE|nr:SIMPL domain-containing protein [Acidaminococcales bacterium]MDR3348094.1 SIMPL domain-containing protein [Acidaminococcales bacterium]